MKIGLSRVSNTIQAKNDDKNQSSDKKLIEVQNMNANAKNKFASK